jgi:hypothetical protein
MGVIALLLGFPKVALPAATSQPVVPRYGIFEQTFDWNSVGYANPWEQVQVTMTLTSPTGRQVTVGGFYYAPNTWKARFAPNQLGDWTWQAVLTDGSRAARSTGSFTVVESDWPGFVRPNPQNRFRWIFDNGAPYYPIGIGDCILDDDRNGSPLDNWGFDGSFRPPEPELGRRTDIDTYLSNYSTAGINLFRWSLDNCAFGMHQSIQPAGNVYLVNNGMFGDQLVTKLRQYRLRTYMVLFNSPAYASNPTAAQLDAIKRYVKYLVDLNQLRYILSLWVPPLAIA